MTSRFIHARLADPSHKLPVPGTARLFSTALEGELIDPIDAFWAGLLADGSLVRVAAAAPSPAPAQAPAPEAASAAAH